MRATEHGPMWFAFRIGPDGWLEVAGFPTAAGEGYRRRGPYRLEGSWLLSPAINEGRPVRLRPEGDELVLTVDEALGFRLRRR